jgi:hypothetical protein
MSDSGNKKSPAYYYPSYDHKKYYQQYRPQPHYYTSGPPEQDPAWSEKLAFDLQEMKKEKAHMGNEIRIYLLN